MIYGAQSLTCVSIFSHLPLHLSLPSPPSPRNLNDIKDREICCYSISCKERENIGKSTCGQSQVEIEHCSVVYFDTFEVP